MASGLYYLSTCTAISNHIHFICYGIVHNAEDAFFIKNMHAKC